MANTGALVFSNSVNDGSAGGDVPWTNPDRAANDNNSYATCFLGPAQTSQYINLNTPSGLSIPAGATINGIVIDIDRKASFATGVTYIHDNVICLIQGTTHGTNKALAASWPTSEARQSYGSSTDTWGFTWSPSGITAIALGIQVACRDDLDSTNITASVDYAQITIYYTVNNRRRSVVTRLS